MIETIEQLQDDRYHVCRGDYQLSPGYRDKTMAERELTYKQQEEYRILIGEEGRYHPQWRWRPEWFWTNFKHKIDYTFVSFSSLADAERWMKEQDIADYHIVREVRLLGTLSE